MGRKIPITPEQEALPISKYYHREPAPIPAEKLALLAEERDALLMTEREDDGEEADAEGT